MSAVGYIIYRRRSDGIGFFQPEQVSIEDGSDDQGWLERLNSWLLRGEPPGRAYLDFGPEAALIRWCADAQASAVQHAVAHVGPSDTLTASYALKVPDLEPVNLAAAIPAPGAPPSADYRAIEALARSSDAVALLASLLTRVVDDGDRRVTLPSRHPSLSAAVMCGFLSIYEMLGAREPVSFLTRAASPPGSGTAGLLISFSQDAPEMPSAASAFTTLTAAYAADPAKLRQDLRSYGLPESAVGRRLGLLEEWSAGTRGPGGRARRIPPPAGSRDAAEPEPGPPPIPALREIAPAARRERRPERAAGREDRNGRQPAPGSTVLCPICLEEIPDWNSLDYWQWDPGEQAYRELVIPPGLGWRQQAMRLRGAHVRCSAPESVADPHYLPVNYGRYGQPVLLGFVGLTRSGKTHLLASMINAIENGELEEYKLTFRPIDLARHQRYLDEWVRPLIDAGRMLPDTREGIVEFADAFLMSYDRGPERPVALFDVAGGELVGTEETKSFLLIADGLFFTIDAGTIGERRLGDDSFRNVLDVLRQAERPGPVSAAIVLNKADKVRFDPPVDRWLRTRDPGSGGGVLDPLEFLRESADVYGYLHRRAASLTRPYDACDKATLHVASPTGGEPEDGTYPRGVTPLRVLRPLVAMLAMTGVLAAPEAAKVGV